jgi:hypothetical protein
MHRPCSDIRRARFMSLHHYCSCVLLLQTRMSSSSRSARSARRSSRRPGRAFPPSLCCCRLTVAGLQCSAVLLVPCPFLCANVYRYKLQIAGPDPGWSPPRRRCAQCLVHCTIVWYRLCRRQALSAWLLTSSMRVCKRHMHGMSHMGCMALTHFGHMVYCQLSLSPLHSKHLPLCPVLSMRACGH